MNNAEVLIKLAICGGSGGSGSGACSVTIGGSPLITVYHVGGTIETVQGFSTETTFSDVAFIECASTCITTALSGSAYTIDGRGRFSDITSGNSFRYIIPVTDLKLSSINID